MTTKKKYLLSFVFFIVFFWLSAKFAPSLLSQIDKVR